jgi:hypothetical protein
MKTFIRLGSVCLIRGYTKIHLSFGVYELTWHGRKVEYSFTKSFLEFGL